MVEQVFQYIKPHVAIESQARNNALFAFGKNTAPDEATQRRVIQEQDVALDALLDLIPMGNEPAKTA